MLMSSLLRRVEEFFPLRGRWLLLAFVAVLILALMVSGGVESATPGLRIWPIYW